MLNLGEDAAVVRDNPRPVVSKIKVLCEMNIAERRRPQDSSFRMAVQQEGQSRTIDFRVSVIPSTYGENVVVRILDKRQSPIEMGQLGLSIDLQQELTRALAKPTGLFLVTGPTGSGKSSTLYAVLSELNVPGVKMITVEDPVEYSIEGVVQAEINEMIGNTFPRFLRSFMRQDPDIIMVGEIRDAETAAIAMRAALTGHTVFSTLHTNDSTSAVNRLIDLGVDSGLLATTLQGVMAQRLVRKICTSCRQPHVPSEEVLKEFGLTGTEQVFHYGRGCTKCNFTGFSGRKPVVELWLPSREEGLWISKGLENSVLRQRVFPGKRRTMLEEGIRLVKAGETTLEELLRIIPWDQVCEFREKGDSAVTWESI
jgi:type II secretory ATPase GspE/PulE/Tfp pilus assembly ATPase PilB-like protein